MSSATSGDRTSNLKVLIKFLTGSSSSQPQTHPIPEGVAFDSLVLDASPGQVTACHVPASPEAAGPVASGEKVEPCPAARQPCRLPPSQLCGAPGVLCLLTAQPHFAQVSPNERQQQEMARQAEKYSKSPKEGGHCVKLLQGSLKRSSRGRPPCRLAHRMFLCGSPLSLASVCGDEVSRNSGD